VLRKYGRALAAVSAVWFIYDLIVYPFNIYSSSILNNITGGSTDLAVIFGWNTVINLFGMPGAILGSFVADYLGAKWTLIVALVIQGIIGCIMSGLYVKLTEHIAVFSFLYGLFSTFGEFGPGLCTFLLASKCCPTAVRGQFFGIAAAAGKAGAFIGIWIFPPIINAFGGPDSIRGNTGPFWIGSAMAFLNAFVTLFFVHPLDSDGMDEEDAKFREYLEAHGYDTSMMGLEEGSGYTTAVEENIMGIGRKVERWYRMRTPPSP